MKKLTAILLITLSFNSIAVIKNQIYISIGVRQLIFSCLEGETCKLTSLKQGEMEGNVLIPKKRAHAFIEQFYFTVPSIKSKLDNDCSAPIILDYVDEDLKKHKVERCAKDGDNLSLGVYTVFKNLYRATLVQ